MKVVSLIYTPTFSEQAILLQDYLHEEGMLLFNFELDPANADLIWTNYQTALSLSDLLIPLLFPVQADQQTYRDIRHFFSLAGEFEQTRGKTCLPIYLQLTELQAALAAGTLRYPQQFFSNTFAHTWNNFISAEDNLQIFKNKISALRQQVNATPINTTSDILQLIAKNHLPEALKAIKKLIESLNLSTDDQDTFLQIENLWHQHQTLDLRGVRSEMDSILSHNQMTARLLDFVRKIEDSIR